MLQQFPWLSVLPPILAIVGAMYLRNVYLALGLAILCGNVILLNGNIFTALSESLQEQIVRQIIPADGGLTHGLILLFTLGTGSAVELMRLTRGAEILMQKLSRFVKNRTQGQLATWVMGILIFFDDYANSMIVGTVARPLTDRLKISREKLAYLIDTTSAPVAGLALISTWVGAELSYIQEAYSAANLKADAFGIFIATLPYRFYPWLALFFGLLICVTGRDFGAMYRAEQQALLAERKDTTLEDINQKVSGRYALTSFLMILICFIVTVLVAIGWTGSSSLNVTDFPQSVIGYFQLGFMVKILSSSNSNLALLWGSFISTMLGIVLLRLFSGNKFEEIFSAIFRGMGNMLPACSVLILAWGIANICDKDHLNTANYLGSLIQGRVNINYMPLVAFVLSCIISLTTGSSWSTMGLLIPLIVPIIVQGYGHKDGMTIEAYDPVLLNTVGAILAGSIFGDHCSPLSDTTVLSSAAAQCDHLKHVETQYPYAFVVGLTCIVTGYLPMIWGLPVVYGWLLSVGMLVGVIFIFGKRIQNPVDPG